MVGPGGMRGASAVRGAARKVVADGVAGGGSDVSVRGGERADGRRSGVRQLGGRVAGGKKVRGGGGGGAFALRGRGKRRVGVGGELSFFVGVIGGGVGARVFVQVG